MTRKEFQEIVNEVTGMKKTDCDNISIKWLTGGAWGGNCWDDSSPESYCPTPEKEPEFSNLDTILLKIAPNISFLQYKKLMEIAQCDTRTEFEYYGNHTTYSIKKILIEDLWNKLKEMNLV